MLRPWCRPWRLPTECAIACVALILWAVRVMWENRDELPFAWRILKHGVCDGCALGTSGLKDWTQEGVHLCMVRLELMRLNTAPALDPERLKDVSPLAGMSSRELRALGRLPEPMIRRKGEKGFRVVAWDEAYAAITEQIRATQAERFAERCRICLRRS